MTTKVINLIGAPGTGKSTIASELFAKMKWRGMDVELISEYAKDLVWEQRHETFKDELYIFGKQYHRLHRLNGKVEYIITDGPIILSGFYNEKYGDNSEYHRDYVNSKFNSFQNINYFLQRTKPYVEKGRNQKEEEANEIAAHLFAFLIREKVSFKILKAIQDITSDQILKDLYDNESDIKD